MKEERPQRSCACTLHPGSKGHITSLVTSEVSVLVLKYLFIWICSISDRLQLFGLRLYLIVEGLMQAPESRSREEEKRRGLRSGIQDCLRGRRVHYGMRSKENGTMVTAGSGEKRRRKGE